MCVSKCVEGYKKKKNEVGGNLIQREKWHLQGKREQSEYWRKTKTKKRQEWVIVLAANERMSL